MGATMSKVESPLARGFVCHHPPAQARYEASVVRWLQTLPHEGLNESGFGGWADEKVEMAREAAALLSQKKKSIPNI
jgi:hypothetical protein